MSRSSSARILLRWATLPSKTSSSARTCKNLSSCTDDSALTLLCSFDVSSAFLIASRFRASFQSSALALACCSCLVRSFSWVFLKGSFWSGRGSSNASWNSLLPLPCLWVWSVQAVAWICLPRKRCDLVLFVVLSAFLGRLASMTWRGHGSSCTKINWLWRMPRLLIIRSMTGRVERMTRS